MIKCGDKAPDSTWKMVPCSVHGGEFPHKGRGRTPKMCPYARENAPLVKETPIKKGTAVPTFEPMSDYEIGDKVYRLSESYASEVVKRRFAHEYKVLSVDPLTVIRTTKTGYRNYPVTVDKSYKFYTKTGTEYLDLAEETSAEDED